MVGNTEAILEFNWVIVPRNTNGVTGGRRITRVSAKPNAWRGQCRSVKSVIGNAHPRFQRMSIPVHPASTNEHHVWCRAWGLRIWIIVGFINNKIRLNNNGNTRPRHNTNWIIPVSWQLLNRSLWEYRHASNGQIVSPIIAHSSGIPE